MSFALDVNILLYASDSGGARHREARDFLEQCLAGPELMYLGWPTVMGYLRMATHPSIFRKPLSPAEAEHNIDSILGLRHVRVLAEGDGFWEVYQSVTGQVPTRGNLVPDSHLAALLLHHGIKTLYTRDRDFRKYDFLTVRDPLA